MNSDLISTLNAAMQHYQAGRLSEAEGLYREVLVIDPRQCDAFLGMGLIAYGRRDFHLAAEWFGKAAAADPLSAGYQSNLGSALALCGRGAESLAAFKEAVRLDPALPQAHNNLANALRSSGRLEEAVESYQRALKLKGDEPGTYFNLGRTLHDLGKLDQAAAAYRTAIRLKPGFVEAQTGLGAALVEAGLFDQAIAACSEAVRAGGRSPQLYDALGDALRATARIADAAQAYNQAIELYKKAVELRPTDAGVCSDLATVMKKVGRTGEAEGLFRRAIALRPDFADAYSNLGNTLRELGRPIEAKDVLEKAIALKPDMSAAHFNLGVMLLLLEDFERGWNEYDWRLREPKYSHAARNYSGRPWRGEDLQGKTILLHTEQGLGDTIQFVRYAALLAARGAAVVLELPPHLRALLGNAAGVRRSFVRGEDPGKYDFHCSLLSLPGVFKTSLQTIPANIPYVIPEPRAVERWKAKMQAGQPAFAVGLAWAGRPENPNDRNRSIALELLAPLGPTPGVTFYSLQKDGSSQTKHGTCELRLIDWSDELKDFGDTAGLIANLDLVITVDTAVAHLAGAMGKPVWVMIPQAPDWRWMLGREDSPWYPTMRLFRQSRAGDWAGVVENIRQELTKVANGGQPEAG